jgi:RNA 3'-terminal phosphate cyclase (ATP)
VIEIDGSDGGGQVVRTAVSLAAVTGRAVRIEGVRADRPDPGLKAQHLTAIEAVAAACDATVEGLEVGADAVTFDPGPVHGGEVTVEVGTAGAVTLVCDALLPLATALDAPLTARIGGGTDVKWSPPVAAHRRVKLPLVEAYGLFADLQVTRRGFYPAGGGEVTLELLPSTPDRIELTARGDPTEFTPAAVASADLADAEVADRLAGTVRDGVAETLRADGYTVVDLDEVDVREAPAPTDPDVVSLVTDVEYAETASTGAGVTLTGDYRHTRVGFDALGERGVPAEAVAESVLDEWRAWRRGPGVVDVHVADQLVVPLALTGGRVRVPRATEHLRTNCRTVAAFDEALGTDVRLLGDDADDDSGGEGRDGGGSGVVLAAD